MNVNIMEGYIFFLSDMVSMLVRGAYATVLVFIIIYFGFVKSERQKFHYGFVYCCLGLLVSLTAGTVTRLMQKSTSFYVGHLGTLADMMIIPLFALFGYLLIRQPKQWQKYFWKFAATEIPYLLSIFFFLSQVKGEEQSILAHRIESTMISYSLLFCIGCIAIGIFYIRWIRKKLPDVYSSIDDRELSWFRNILIGMPVLLSLYLFMDYLAQGFNTVHTHTLYLLMSIICIIHIAINLNHQRAVDFEMLEDVGDMEHESEDAMLALDEKLRVLFEERLGYTRPDITIRQVSRITGTDIHALSQHLNASRGMNFTQYINKLRIEQACRLLKQGELSSAQVASATGFRQYSAFFQVFKLHTGYSPIDYPLDRGEDVVTSPKIEKEEKLAPLNTEPHKQLVLDLLNERELLLCRLIAQGLSNEEICEKMSISVSSLRVTRSRLRSRLGLDRKESLDKYLERYLKESQRS